MSEEKNIVMPEIIAIPEEEHRETLTRWQDPTIDDLIKENLELKRKLGEANEAVEYWQLECDKRSKILDKIKEIFKDYGVKEDIVDYSMYQITGKEVYTILELLEEIK